MKIFYAFHIILVYFNTNRLKKTVKNIFLSFFGVFFRFFFGLGGNGTPPAILSPGACVCLEGISQKNRPPDLFFGKRHEELLIALRIQNADRLNLIRRGLFKEHSAVAIQHVRFGFQDPDLRGGNRAAFP